MNKELIISLIALLISIVNFLYIIISKWFRIEIEIIAYDNLKINGKDFIVVKLVFMNKSDLPLSINKIVLKKRKIMFEFERNKYKLLEGNRTKNGEVIDSEKIYSFDFPINISNLDSIEGNVILKPNKNLSVEDFKTIEVYTTRGKKNTRINFLLKRKPIKEFIDLHL